MQAETEVIPSEHESFKWLLEALCDELVEVHGDPANEDASWIRVVTDSRIVRAGDVFVALSGERTDGHRYLLQAAESGAFCLVVEHVETGLNVPQLVVENSRRAYGLIARAWRRRFGIALTAVGGSNGKTTTTQMMKAILAAHWGVQNIHATEGNFNNDVGVPHTLLGLHCGCRAAVVEAGMNHRGEMARLADWIRPTVVLMTNAQREHQAYLETVAEAAFENGLLIAALPNDGVAVYPADDPCADVWASYALARGVRTLTYATAEGVAADVRGELVPGKGLRLLAYGIDRVIGLQVQGAHNIHNAVGAAAAALAQQIDVDAIAEGLAAFKALPGRGARMASPAGFTLIDDAYNCNPDSAIASIAMLAEEKPARIFLFGDMGELGRDAELWHAEVGGAAKTLGIDYFWAAGPLSKHAAEAFGIDGVRGRWFADRGELIAHLPELPLKGATVAVKASHSSGFGKVVETLKHFPAF